VIVLCQDHYKRRRKKKTFPIPQATFLIRGFSLLSICLFHRIIIIQAPFLLYIYVQSRLALLFFSFFFSLIYHCRKQGVVTIEYLLSYLTISSSKRERETTTITTNVYYIVCPFYIYRYAYMMFTKRKARSAAGKLVRVPSNVDKHDY
jgi:hypothetical protein